MRGAKFEFSESNKCIVSPSGNSWAILTEAQTDVTAWLGFGEDVHAYLDALEEERERIFERATY